MQKHKRFLALLLIVVMTIGSGSAFATEDVSVEDAADSTTESSSSAESEYPVANTQITLDEDCVDMKVVTGEPFTLTFKITHSTMNVDEKIRIALGTRTMDELVITNDTPSPTTWTVTIDDPEITDKDSPRESLSLSGHVYVSAYIYQKNEQGEWEKAIWNTGPHEQFFTVSQIPNLSEASNVSNGIQLTFRKLVFGETTTNLVNVYRKASGESKWTKVANQYQLTGPEFEWQNWTDTDVENGKMYTYSIKGVNRYTYALSDRSLSKKYYYLNQPKGLSVKNSSSGKTMTISWNRNNKASGYEIQYATNESMKNAKTRTVSGYKNNSLKLKNRTPDKQYWIQVRSYKTVNGVKYYSAWSDVRTRYETE